MRFIALFLLAFSFVFGGDFQLSSSIINSCKSQKSLNILKDYEKFMNEVKNKEFHDKLRRVNFYINTILPKYDSIDPNIDYWMSRGEFLKAGGGDCEDYAIAKMQTLKDLGVSEKMGLLVVYDNFLKGYHLVLLLFEKGSDDPLVLDNLSFKILPLSKRVDLKPDILIEDGQYFRYKDGKFTKANIRLAAYEDFIKRSEKEKIWK